MTDDKHLSSTRQGEKVDKERAIQDELLFLARALRDMPDREPPSDLADRIVRSVKPKRISLWRRFFLWLAAPRSLTISPIKLIPVALGVCVGLLLITHFVSEQKFPIHQGKENLVSVIFTLQYPQARSVSLIGSFNQWDPKGFEMSSHEEGNRWVLELKLPTGRYEYAFLVNGEAVLSDPTSPFSESDGFGNQNSIIFVTNDDAKDI
jgi:hypothetical protein